MKKTAIFLLFVLIITPLAAYADGAATYKAKCQMCHGADGKKLAKANLIAAAAKPEAELVTFLTTDAKHKSKVADAATAKELVKFLKTLK